MKIDRNKLIIKMMILINDINEDIVKTPLTADDMSNLDEKMKKIVIGGGDMLESYRFATVRRSNAIAMQSMISITDEEFIKFYNNTTGENII